ncbi:MAG: tetratricopeptide repeat protein [Myxococcota bacterium]
MVAAETLPSDILDVLERVLGRNPTLWIGAGVSAQAAPPLPTLWRLAEGLREAPIGWKKMPEFDDPYAAFDEGLKQRIFRKNELHTYLEKRLRPDGKDPKPGPLHHHLASLAWAQTFPFIVDTNYDLLLRRAMQEIHAPHTHSTLEQNLTRPGKGCWYLSIHGDVTDWSKVVLTSDSYDGFDDRYRYLKGQLDLLLAQHAVLFLGCSMLDPHLLDWLDGLGLERRSKLNTWVALVGPGGTDTLKQQTYKGQSVFDFYGDLLHVLELPSFKLLPRLFQSLASSAVATREANERRLTIDIHADSTPWRIEAGGETHEVDPPDLGKALVGLRTFAGKGLPCNDKGICIDPSGTVLENEMQQLARSTGQTLTGLLPPAGLGILERIAGNAASRGPALVSVRVHGEEAKANNALVLPWELLMLGSRFPVALGEVHIVREAVTPGVTEGLDPNEEPPALSVVAHVAAPKAPNLPELNLEEASYRMARALTRIEGQTLFTEMGTLEDLGKAVHRVSPVVLHFAGHGLPGKLVFEDEDCAPHGVTANELLIALRLQKTTLPRAIWLSCCYGAGPGKPAAGDTPSRAREWGVMASESPSIAADLHRAGIPQILGYFGPVPDPLAVEVDRHLFEGLAETGYTLEAVRQARLRTQQAIDTGKGWARFPLAWTLLSLYHRGPNLPLIDATKTLPKATAARLVPEPEKVQGLDVLGFGFIGRRRLLARLRREWGQNHQRVLGLYGLGGLGKTATMIRLCRVLLSGELVENEQWQDKALVLPLQLVDGQEQLRTEPFAVLRELVDTMVEGHPLCPPDWNERLDAIEQADEQSSRGRALAELVLSVCKGGVLYIDNGETMQVERTEMDGELDKVPWRSEEVAAFFRTVCGARLPETTVLLTTRYRPADTPGWWAPIEPCSKDEIFRMTRWHPWLRRLPPVLREELVSTRLAGHPRAVKWANALVEEQAQRWQEDCGQSLREDLPSDRVRREVLEPALEGLPDKAAADLLLETLLERQTPEALALLGECCGIGLPVPFQVVRRMGDGADALRSRGLLTSMQEQQWGVHPFVREVVERRIDGPPWSKAGRGVLVDYWENVCSKGAPEASHRELLEQALAAELWAKARATVATLEEAFRRRGWAKARLELIEGVKEQPWPDPERDWLLYTLSDALDSMGRYDEAEQAIRQSLKLSERVHGTREHGSVAASLHGLANVLENLGRYEEAKEVYEESISIQEGVYGTREHGSVASSLHGLANVLGRLGRYEEAKEVYEESISIKEHVYGTREHDSVASSLHGLANVLVVLGRYEEAKEVYEESISITERVYGTREHGEVAASLSGLANVLVRLGRYEEAEEVYEESISILGRVYGTREHGSVAASLHGLAIVLVRLGRYKVAERAFREALAIQERVFGSRRTPASILTLVVFAKVLVQHQRPHDALPLARDGWEGALEHNSLLDAVQAGPIYAVTLARAGQEDEAQQVRATVVQLLQQLPEGHPVRVLVEKELRLLQ